MYYINAIEASSHHSAGRCKWHSC